METKAFAELGLSPKVLAAVEASGYTIATPIQSAAIPIAIAGRDVLGIAQTGTGKTAAFTLPMITRLETGRARARMPRSLILAPTRELAAQVAQAFEKYGVNHKLDVALLIGGVSMDDQVKKLDRGVDVLIATPGRLLDHFGRGRIMLMGVEILVIDEADRMLDMGFIPDIEKICKLLPPKRQTLFFSATMPAEITRLVDTFLKDPVRVEVAKPATTAKTITQRFRFCRDGEDYAKREALRDLMRVEDVRNAIIFCNRKRDVAILLKSLLKHGFNAGALHGDMEQSARTATLDKFRSGEITFLAASDVAARGLDIPDVSHIFNFDLPWQSDDYVHRIGRTGRAGKLGYSASLVTGEDLKLLKDIEKITGEAAIWLGDPPNEDDMSNAGKRRRGRGASAGGGRGADRGARRDSRPESRGEERGRERPRRSAPRPELAQAPGAELHDSGRASAEQPIEFRAGSAETADRPIRASEPPRPPRRERPQRSERRPDAREHERQDTPRGGGRQAQSRHDDADNLSPRSVRPQVERPAREGATRDDQRPARDVSRTPREPREGRPNRSEAVRGDAPRGSDRQQREPQGNDRHAGRRPEILVRGADAHPAAKPGVRDRQAASRQPNPAGSAAGSGGGFADNVPAFLRKPSRPIKVGGD